MAAYFETGFSVRQPMWHGQGLVLGEYPEDWTEARAKAGLGWEPVERQAFALFASDEFVTCLTCGEKIGQTHDPKCGLIVDLDVSYIPEVQDRECRPEGCYHVADGLMVPATDHKWIVRSDNRRILGPASNEYALIYHGEDFANDRNGASMEEIVDAFRGVDGKVKFETAGSVREGRSVWALMYLDEPYTVPGDDTEHLPFAALLNNHDGSGACKLVNTQVRVVCWNTFQMASAQGDRSGRQFVFRHVGDVKDRIEDAKAAIAGLRNESAEYVEMAQEMMELRADDVSLSAFLSEFLPSPREQGEVVSDRVHENVDKARKMFRSIYLDSVTTEAVRGTAWGLVQASTEYLDHARAFRNPDSFLGRSILRAEPAKAVALNVARKVCK